MKFQHLILAGSFGLAAVAAQACSDDSSSGTPGGSGGVKTGGSNSGGSGGSKTGGSNSGGATTGGAATGGATTGGAATGGAATGGAATGGAATGGASGMAGTGNEAGAAGAPGNSVDALATLVPVGSATLAGTAEFKDLGVAGVKLKLDLTNCPEGVHALHLHENSACDNPGGHWAPNGEVIPTVTCNAGMIGTLNFTADAATWEANTGGANDVTKYTIVIHADPGGGTQLACGEINTVGN